MPCELISFSLSASELFHDAQGSASQRPDGRAVPAAQLAGEQRAQLQGAMERRPMDYVGQEVVRLSTTPSLAGGQLAPHPFSLRVFLARNSEGEWCVMPGGFARLAAHGDIRAVLIL